MIRSELDVLLDKVADPALRADLRSQIDRVKRRRSFGLVFEQHIPERVRLPQHPIRVGSQVVRRDADDSPTYEVTSLQDGVASRDDIDEGMVAGCGMPMGPLRLSDLVGLDTLKLIADKMYEEFKEPLYAAPPLLLRMVEAGQLGKKSGRGFYTY